MRVYVRENRCFVLWISCLCSFTPSEMHRGSAGLAGGEEQECGGKMPGVTVMWPKMMNGFVNEIG